MAHLWSAAGHVGDEPELIAVRADALEAMRAANNRRWPSRLAGRWRPLVAAAACLLLTVTAILHLMQVRPDTYVTAIGERRVVKLGDGSKISLDADTRVQVAYNDERRALRLLSGRAKFDVAKDPRRPFTVTAGNRMVVATGTAFSVELVSRQMRVVLYEGNVAVLENGPSNEPPKHVQLIARKVAADQDLKPGRIMIASLDRPVAAIEAIDLPRSLLWEGGQLNFSDEFLATAIERVNRYSDTKIVLRGNADGMLVSGAFNAGDSSGFVDGVSAIYPLNVQQKGNVIALTVKRPS
ncbi:FecR family protein [Sphingomonas crusticola]|uniref:FecR family protein n=1 Tax=Sphingomonas crusticola TaxID=1697973 RepID=UPI001F07E4AF|nr:FecR domain-containing protein [Sphingomonas crusticola]